jgi:hypothetical protein
MISGFLCGILVAEGGSMDIEQRFAHLERSNRRLRTGLLSLTIAITTVLIVGLAKPEKVPDVITAKAFQVVNNDGLKLVRMAGAPSGRLGGVTTYNDKGQALVTLGATVNGDGAITTLNGKGQKLVALSATADGKGLVTTFNDRGQRLLRLGSGPNGNGGVVSFSDKGKMLVLLGAMEDGEGGVVTFDGDGRITHRLGNK